MQCPSIARGALLLVLLAPAGELRAAAAAAATGGSIALERGLATVSAAEISSDIFFIASDELAGRDTPSPGQRVAALYLRARLQRLGWQPGAEDGYFFRYPLSQPRVDPKRCSVTLSAAGGERALAFGRDYFYLSSVDALESTFSGEVVYCGEGRAEDFEAATPKGAWALCVDAKITPHQLRRRAEKSGVLGLIVFAGPGSDAKPYAERFADVLKRVQKGGSVTWPRDAERQVTPCLLLESDAARALLALAEPGAPVDKGDWLPAVGQRLAVNVRDERHLDGDGGNVELQNVCGFWPGSDPELAKEVVIVSAHYDHVGVSGGEIYNGADDNGSGTCTLLALAEALSEYGPMRRSVMLIWVSGEEKGLFGSRAFAERPWFPLGGHAIANINIDMVGRNAPEKLLVTPSRDHELHNGLVRMADAFAPEEGFPELGDADEYYHRSDQAEFAKLGIPVCFLFSDIHEDYHQPGDDPEKIDTDKIRRVSRLVLRMLDAMQADEPDIGPVPGSERPEGAGRRAGGKRRADGGEPPPK